MEKSYNKLSKTAKKSINKFASLPTTKCMEQYGKEFRTKTGRNPNNVDYKEEFFSFVAKNKIKC